MSTFNLVKIVPVWHSQHLEKTVKFSLECGRTTQELSFLMLLPVQNQVLFSVFCSCSLGCNVSVFATSVIKAKGKVHAITCHEGTDGEYRYICTDSLTSVLDGGGWLMPCLGRWELPGTPCMGGWVAL
jgi:hypothetical protein